VDFLFSEKPIKIYEKENILSSVYLQANSSLESHDTINAQTHKEGFI